MDNGYKLIIVMAFVILAMSFTRETMIILLNIILM